MEFTRRHLLKGAAALGVAGAVPATLARPAVAQTTQKKELVSAQAGDISKFDPHISTSSNDIRVSFNIFDNLTSRHPDGKLYPGLATEWKLEGQTTWRFKLRPGVKFHNGDPFTSADAKWSLERTYDPGREDPGGHRVHHHRPDRGAGCHDARDPHEEARSAPARRGSPSTVARSCRRSTWNRRATTRSTPSRRHGAGALRVVDQGRQGRHRRQPRLLGRQDRRRPLDHAADPRDRAARGRAAQGRGGRHHPAPARPGRAGQRQCLDHRSRARSTRGSTSSPSTASGRRSTTRSSSRRCRSPSTARPS